MTIKQLCSAWIDFSKLNNEILVHSFINKEVEILYDGGYYNCPNEILNRKVRAFGMDGNHAVIEVY